MSVNLKSAVFYMESDDPSQKNENRVHYKLNASWSKNEFCATCQKPSDDLVKEAVLVQNATKSYRNGVPVIKNLNMKIQKGTIYSLLGSSGCGKSTTLSCILGITKFTSGSVLVFGKKPGSRDSGVPGKLVGYMPQDYSLYNEFSLIETFMYFGTLNGMTTLAITNAIIFYMNLLLLPSTGGRIGVLSGGQKRRVSFAIALMHNPALLILDEPTVGVDPLLRERIWKYLVELTINKKTTVIITTHYIDESRLSNTVGVMRHGRLLVESSPTLLLQQFNTTSLETVVLALCQAKDNEATRCYEDVEQVTENSSNENIIFGENCVCGRVNFQEIRDLKSDNQSQTESVSNFLVRIHALTQKNVFIVLRSFIILLMMIIVPAVGIFVTFIADGRDLSNVNFGVVNLELNNHSTCTDLQSAWNSTCDLTLLSCKFLNHLAPPTFILEQFHTTEEAEHATHLGDIWGYIKFPQEFSWEFYERAASGIRLDPGHLNKSDIIVQMDESSTIVSRQIKYSLYKAFQKFVRDLLVQCGHDPRKADSSLQYNGPILGVRDTDFRDFVIPSNFIGFMFFWPIVSSGIRYVTEKREGTLERSLVSGIKMWEIFLSYSITEFVIAVLRILLIYAMAIWVFELRIVGSLWLQLILGLLACYMGVAAGFLIGSFCTEEIQVALLALAIFLPNSLLSGMVWPVEGMTSTMQSISYFLPCTLACESMRSLTSRGWEFSHPNVWPGFASSFGFIMLFFILAMCISSFKFIR